MKPVLVRKSYVELSVRARLSRVLIPFLRICFPHYFFYLWRLIQREYNSYNEEWAVSCGCVVLCGGSGAGDVRGALDDHWGVNLDTERCSCLLILWVIGIGASVYLGPGAEAACRNASTAASCPGFPCPTFPPRSCNTTHCRRIRKKPGKLTVWCGRFFPVSFRQVTFLISIPRRS